MYTEDKNYVKLPIGREAVRFLKFHKFLPENDSTPMDSKNLLSTMFRKSYIAILVQGALIHLIAVHLGKIDADITEDIMVITNSLFFLFVYLISYFKFREVICFMADLADYREFGKPETADRLVKRQNVYTGMIYFSCSAACIVYAVICYFEEASCEERNRNNQKQDACGVMLPLWLPLNILDNIYFRRFILILQLLVILSCVPCASAGTYMSIIISDHITQRIQHLKIILKQTSEETQYESIQKHMSFCVRYHQSIIRMVTRMNYCFADGNKVHMLLTSLVFAVVEYQVIMLGNYKGLLQLMGWMFLVGLLGFSGQTLINESSSIAWEVYSIEWYRIDPKLAVYFQLMIARAQKPLKMSAGLFFSHSFELIQTICQTSYKYMTLLNQIDF